MMILFVGLSCFNVNVDVGVRQGDALSVMLFNLVLNYTVDMRGNK
jgi:hypothetical protein